MTNKLLEKFQAAQHLLKLRGNLIIVQELQSGPVTKQMTGADGRKINFEIASGTNIVSQRGAYNENKPTFVQALQVGPGYYDEATQQDLPLSVKPGSIFLVPSLAVQYFSSWGQLLSNSELRIGFIRDTDILGEAVDEAAYKQYFEMMKD